MADGQEFGARDNPKVFIAYPHKPTAYQQYVPPQNAAGDPEFRRRFEEEVVAHGMAAEGEIRSQEEAVKRFADFLHTQLVTVYHDLLIRDTGTANIMRWCQQRIAESDYLIIITTPSLLQFLDGRCPPDKEPLFSADFLYNLIHSSPRRRSDGKPLEMIPVFLGRPKNLEQVPLGLQGSSMYEVWDSEYREPLSEGITRLLCRLTRQNRYEPPPPGKMIVIQPIQPTFGPKFKKATQETPQPQPSAPPPPYLMNNQQALTTRSLTSLSEKSGFSQQWRSIAPHLGLSPTEVERCQGLGAGDDSEACLQMLILRSQRHHDSPLTLAALADAIEKSGCSYLYETLQSVL